VIYYWNIKSNGILYEFNVSFDINIIGK